MADPHKETCEDCGKEVLTFKKNDKTFYCRQCYIKRLKSGEGTTF